MSHRTEHDSHLEHIWYKGQALMGRSGAVQLQIESLSGSHHNHALAVELLKETVCSHRMRCNLRSIISYKYFAEQEYL